MMQKEQTLSVVTGTLNIHEVVDNAVGPEGGFKYLTVEEMSILYPFLVPLTHKAKQFTTAKDTVRGRVSERFQMDDLDLILSDNKIQDVFIMSQIFNYEASLQILTDILGYGGYHTSDGESLGSKNKLRAQPLDI